MSAHLRDRDRGGRLTAWVAALRLPFHPMAWLGYTLGAVAASAPAATSAAPGFQAAPFWLGLGFVFCLETATVLINDHQDYASDRRNRNHSRFTGGSRVLVEGRLGFGELRVGIGVALLLTALCAAALLALLDPPLLPAATAVAFLAVLAVGYTAPPLALCYRGLGELDVAVTMGVGVVLCGYLFQGGSWHAPLPWLLAAPLALAMLASITLSGVPDLTADRAVGKRTLAVRWGVAGARRLAAAAVVLAAAAALAADRAMETGYASPLALGGMLLHAGVLLTAVARIRHGPDGGRIDGTMALALTYLVWFSAFPLAQLLGASSG